MTQRMRGRLCLAAAFVGASLGAFTAVAGSRSAHGREPGFVDAFEARVKAYVALHRKLESTLPRLPKRHTPEQLDQHQRALFDLIRTARGDAAPGEFFTPQMQDHLRGILVQVLSGPEGNTMKASIMDENLEVPRIVVNERYPAAFPLSTMPPRILARFPELHGDLEYHFMGSRLILLDTEAELIVDFTEEILPKP